MALIKHNNNSISNVTSFAQIPAGTPTLISTQTASGSASISFTGIDSTYDVYQFEFINIHPATDSVNLQFQCSTDGGSSYGVTLTPAEKAAWMNYRTLLRNITDGLDTVDEVQSTTLPVAP